MRLGTDLITQDIRKVEEVFLEREVDEELQCQGVNGIFP